MKLLIPERIKKQLFCYVEEIAPYEVTGIGTIKVRDDKQSFEVTEIFLPEQEVSVDACNSTTNALHRIIFELIKDGPARAGELRFRWHSHGDDQVFWSAVDERDIEDTDCDWIVNLVTNSRHDVLARLDLFQPLRVANLPLEVVEVLDIEPEIVGVCRAEIGAKVKIKKLKQPRFLEKEEWLEDAPRFFGSEENF